MVSFIYSLTIKYQVTLNPAFSFFKNERTNTGQTNADSGETFTHNLTAAGTNRLDYGHHKHYQPAPLEASTYWILVHVSEIPPVHVSKPDPILP